MLVWHDEGCLDVAYYTVMFQHDKTGSDVAFSESLQKCQACQVHGEYLCWRHNEECLAYAHY